MILIKRVEDDHQGYDRRQHDNDPYEKKFEKFLICLHDQPHFCAASMYEIIEAIRACDMFSKILISIL